MGYTREDARVEAAATGKKREAERARVVAACSPPLSLPRAFAPFFLRKYSLYNRQSIEISIPTRLSLHLTHLWYLISCTYFVSVSAISARLLFCVCLSTTMRPSWSLGGWRVATSLWSTHTHARYTYVDAYKYIAWEKKRREWTRADRSNVKSRVPYGLEAAARLRERRELRRAAGLRAVTRAANPTAM